MKRVFLLSFDHFSDRTIEHLIPILEGTPYPMRYRTTEMDSFRSIGPEEPVWDEIPFGEKELLDEDRAIYSSLSGVRNPSKNQISPHLLKPEDADIVENLEDQVETGDLVLSIVECSSSDKLLMASYFSSRVISKDAFSICFITRKAPFRDVKEVEVLNREFLDLSMKFHGVVGISPRVVRSGNFINIAHMIRHLVEMNFRSGVINLDQADLLITSKGGSVLVMTWGAARPGGDPAATSVKDALTNQLCDLDLSTVRKALVNVVGSQELSLEDSLLASEVLRKRVRKNARIIWGVNIVQDIGEDMEVFLILSTTPMELLLHWYSRQG
ncbi:MAG: hypothetical protein ACMUIE_09615 [Thermoplasmatota archaeon]